MRENNQPPPRRIFAWEGKLSMLRLFFIEAPSMVQQPKIPKVIADAGGGGCMVIVPCGSGKKFKKCCGANR